MARVRAMAMASVRARAMARAMAMARIRFLTCRRRGLCRPGCCSCPCVVCV